MRQPFIYFLICVFSVTTQAQVGNDPEAAKILESIAAKVQNYTDVTYHFQLNIDFPEQEIVTQQGSYLQKGNHYRLEMPNMISMSDGETQWLIDREAEEVQIHTFLEDDKENLMNPTNLLSIYNNPRFEYMLTGEKSMGGRATQQIEFKPKDKQSEYAKARMTVEKATSEIISVEVFGKDGTKYIVDIKQVQPNQEPTVDQFVFQEKQFPNFHVEDLRID
ncbi:MAG: outer membrane lipoprotein carrier protein LolA [Saprospiraceae bacterium]|nr:outer membrane lipoprotein carrier protein LolA [Saprospiraceae bacterium]